jgi:hypothetical protein
MLISHLQIVICNLFNLFILQWNETSNLARYHIQVFLFTKVSVVQWYPFQCSAVAGNPCEHGSTEYFKVDLVRPPVFMAVHWVIQK